VNNEIDAEELPGWISGLGKASLWLFLPAAILLAPAVAGIRWRFDEIPKIAFWLLLRLPLLAGAVHRAPGVILVGYIQAAAVGFFLYLCEMIRG
jgi:hypothetical protein